MLTGLDLRTIERTLQRAIAPAFLLSGVFALLTNRLQRIADVRDEMRHDGNVSAERRMLARRAWTIYRAITASLSPRCW